MSEEINLDIQVGETSDLSEGNHAEKIEKKKGVKSPKRPKKPRAPRQPGSLGGIMGNFVESIVFSLVSACQNLWRQRLLSLSSILITAITLVTVYFSIGINFTTDYAISYVGKFVDLNIPLYNGVTDAQIDSLINELKVLPYVERVDFKSKETALEEFQSQYNEQLPDFLSQYDLGNPLPNFVKVTTQTPEDQKKIITFLTSPSFAGIVNTQSISFDEDYESKIEVFTRNTQIIQNGAVIISIIFVVLSLLIVINSVQIAIHNRNKDVTIMRIVGASNMQIQLPFIFEALLSGLLAFSVSLIPYYLLKQKFVPILSQQFGTDPLIIHQKMAEHFFNWWIIIIIGIVIFNAFISSFVAQQYLTRKLQL